MLYNFLHFYDGFTNNRLSKIKFIREEYKMGKFSTGLLAGTMIGIGMMMVDRKTIKKAKKLMNKMSYNMSWL